MAIRIVTDSAADIPAEEALKLGITVVPVYLRFGETIYRDGVDIDSDEFFKKLASGSVRPFSSSPSPGDFAKAYQEASREGDEIVSIHITSKHSATMEAANLGKEIAEKLARHIEVVDSKGVTMWQGLVAITAARAAAAGDNLQGVLDKVNETIGQLKALALLDTVRFAVSGGRLGKTIGVLETVLNVKSFLTFNDGEVRPAGVARTWNKGMERLREFLGNAKDVEEVAIVHATRPEEAITLLDHAKSLFPGIIPRLAKIGPALGVHAGPGAVIAVIKQAGNRLANAH